MKDTRLRTGALMALVIGIMGFTSCMTLSQAARSGDYWNVKALVEKGKDVNKYDDGWTPLLWAVYDGYFPIVQLMLENGADPNLALKSSLRGTGSLALGSTPLIVASYYGFTKIVEILMEKNADREQRDRRGYKAVDYAQQFGFTEIVAILNKKVKEEEKKPTAVTPPVLEQPAREQPAQVVRPEKTPVAPEMDAGELSANTMVGFSLGSYQIDSDRYKAVYGADATQTFGLSLSRALIQVRGFSLDLDGGIRFYSKEGLATVSRETATFKMTPISLAGRLNYQWKYFQMFVGYGLDWYSYTESSAVANTTGNANGHHITAGIYLIPPVLDGLIRVKAYYKSTKVTAVSNGISVELGGNEFGAGLSFGFNLVKQAVFSF